MLGNWGADWACAKAAEFAPIASAAPPEAALRRIVRREYFVVIVFPSIPRGMFRTPEQQVNAKPTRQANQFSFAVRPHRRDAKTLRNRVSEKSIFA
jgi:hypothetical protein